MGRRCSPAWLHQASRSTQPAHHHRNHETRVTGITSIGPVRETGLRAQPFVYASARLGLDEFRLMTQSVGGLIVRGRKGAAKVTKLRRGAFSSPVAIDPALYELDADSVPETSPLLGEEGEWLALQQEHRVAFYLSPSD